MDLLVLLTHLVGHCGLQLHLCGSCCLHTHVCLASILNAAATLLCGNGSACNLLLQQLHGGGE